MRLKERIACTVERNYFYVMNSDTLQAKTIFFSYVTLF